MSTAPNTKAAARILQWNNSALATLEKCGERFRRRYVENERVPPSPRMLRGTVVHRIASTTMLRKLSEQEIPSVEEARDLAATEFEEAWAGGVSFDQDTLSAESVGRQKGDSKDFAVDLSAFYVERLAPRIKPVAVERKIEVKPRDSDITIHGTIDLISDEIAGPAGPAGEYVRDLKTSEKSPSSETAEKSQQLTMYAMVRLAEKGALPAGFTLDYLVRTPAKAERKYVPLHTTRDRDDVSALVNRINTAVEAVKRGVFMPTNPENWWCAPQWCDYYGTCVYVRRGNRPRT